MLAMENVKKFNFNIYKMKTQYRLEEAIEGVSYFP